MQFELDLTEHEMEAFEQVVQGRLAALAKTALGGWKLVVLSAIPGIPLGFAVVTFIDLYRANPQLWSDLGTIIGSLIVAWTLLAWGRLYKRKLVEKKFDFRDTWLGAESMVVVADEVGITATSPGSTMQLSWALIREVIEDDATLYLFFNLSHALVLPKRLFRSTDELVQLRGWAKRDADVN
jgi:hypothetical protein